MAAYWFYLSLAGLSFALQPRRDLFGFVDREQASGPGLGPFWSFRTNPYFVQQTARPDDEDPLEAAGTELVSEHELPRDVPTRPELGVPGGWARGQVPNRDDPVDLGFVPVQIYSQSRKYDSEEHLPRERAIAEAEDEEELLAAPRLREVLRNKKLHEVYEEEGYEDLGYDHGGYNHKGVKVEKNVALEDVHYRKSPLPAPSSEAEDLDSAGPKEQSMESRQVNNVQNIPVTDEAPQKSSGNPLTPKKVENSDISDRIDGSNEKYTAESRVSQGNKIVFPGRATRRHYTSLISPIVVVPDPPAAASRTPLIVHQVATFEPSPYYYDTSPSSFSSSSPMQFASTINTYASLINQNITAPLLSLNPEMSQRRFNSSEDYRLSRSDRNTPTEEVRSDSISEEEKPAMESPKNHNTRGRRRGSSRGTSSSNQQTLEAKPFSTADPPIEKVSSTYHPPKKSKVYSNLTRGNAKYSPEDNSEWTPSVGTQNIRHPTMPIDSSEGKGDAPPKPTAKHDQSQSDKQIAIIVPSISKEPTPTKDPSANAKYVEQLTLAHFSAPVYVNPKQTHSGSQDRRLSELAKQLNSPQYGDEELTPQRRRRRSPSEEKYPYYDAPKSISKDSAIKYATNKEVVPKKTYGGMEFYESKESVKCDGPRPPKNVTPRKEGDGEWEEDPMPEGERVEGIGDAINCFKKKYFGKDPLDNPFFKEEEVYSEDTAHERSSTEEKLPPSINSDIRKIMFIENPEFLKKLSDAEGENEKRSLSSSEDDSSSSGESESSQSSAEKSLETSNPHHYSNHQYSVHESAEEPKNNVKTDVNPYNHVKTKSKLHNEKSPKISSYIIKEKKKSSPKYVMYPVSVYSIISTNTIPPHHAPLLIPENRPKFPPIPAMKETSGRHSAQIKEIIQPKIMAPPSYEKKILVTKREVDTDLWGLVNPLQWWFPAILDDRRDEPRHRRSSDNVYLGAKTDELSRGNGDSVQTPSEIKPSTNSPISLAEFKIKFNITDYKPPNKKVTTRLTGGFLNRNPDITDAMEDILEKRPTEASTSSTVATTTIKPKVIFPRAKIPRRKATPPKKQMNISESTTEASTTTSTTTLPPSTTTRMYKPKKVVNKPYGRGPFNAFTALSVSKETTTTTPFDRFSTELTTKEDAKKSITAPDVEPSPSGSPKVSDASIGENQTLTYSVDPVSGVGSWGEQRKWKPKRKRPNTPSIYSYGNATFKSRKRQRDIPDRTKEVYVAGILSQLSNGGNDAQKLPKIGNPFGRSSVSGHEKPVSRPSKLSPRYILEPDKRRYYYAKV